MGVIGWWSQRPVADYMAAGALVGGYRVARLAGLNPVVVQPGVFRVEIYQAGLGLSAAVFAFAVVPTAIVLAVTPGRRLRYLLRNHPYDLYRATLAAAGASLAAMTLCVAALALDAGGSSNSLIRHLVVLILTAEVLGAVRLLELFMLLLLNVARDSESEGHEPVAGPVRPVKRPEVPEGVDVRVVGPSGAARP